MNSKSNEASLGDSSEWHSVLAAVSHIDISATLPQLDEAGVVAYTDGACLNNPGGPAGWSVLVWAESQSADGHARKGAPCVECYGHIPEAETTTNIRAEITAILAALFLAPPTLPLTIYSDSEFAIRATQGMYKLRKNLDLWQIYRELEGKRAQPTTFLWVRGHAGHLHNERADKLAGLGAFQGDHVAYRKWRATQR